MPYMPPAAIEEARRRMAGEAENSGPDQHPQSAPGRWRSGGLQSPQEAAMARMQPQGQPMPGMQPAAPPPPPPGQPMPGMQPVSPAHMLHRLRARLIARGMSPADAARAAAIALRRRSGASHF